MTEQHCPTQGEATQCYIEHSLFTCRTSSKQHPFLTELATWRAPDRAAHCPSLRRTSYCASPLN